MLSLVQRHSKRSDHSIHKHVALIVRHGKIVTIAVNSGWRHAEENAIRTTTPDLLRGATLLSFRVSKTNTLRNAKPCVVRGDGRPSCSELIKLAGIKKVVYSDSNGELVNG